MDDIRQKAEAYVDGFINQMSEGQRPSRLQRANAVAKLEKYSRELAVTIRFHPESEHE